jgi:tetratricopeptide (TPR) repeat protein
MGTVTYPHAEVIEFVTEHFAAAKFNVKEPVPDFKEAVGRGKVIWAPLFIFLDYRGTELRRYLGYLPPDDFLAELRLVLGLAAMTHMKYQEALEWFLSAVEKSPDSSAAPEALFWAGAADYRIGGAQPMIARWDDLIARCPGSTWAKRADVIPPELRER